MFYIYILSIFSILNFSITFIYICYQLRLYTLSHISLKISIIFSSILSHHTMLLVSAGGQAIVCDAHILPTGIRNFYFFITAKNCLSYSKYSFSLLKNKFFRYKFPFLFLKSLVSNAIFQVFQNLSHHFAELS